MVKQLCDVCSRELNKNYARDKLSQRVEINDLKIKVQINCDIEYGYNELCLESDSNGI